MRAREGEDRVALGLYGVQSRQTSQGARATARRVFEAGSREGRIGEQGRIAAVKPGPDSAQSGKSPVRRLTAPNFTPVLRPEKLSPVTVVSHPNIFRKRQP